jgi:GcrA cell cycle regulator
MPAPVTDWTAEACERLEVLWTEGLTASEIARRLHTTRNSVIAKARRLGLPGRPSPIIRTGPKPPPPVIPRKPRRVPIAAAAASLLAPPAALLAPTAVLTAPPPPPIPARRGCEWPLWDDRERATHRFCGAELVPGHSWCAAHLGIIKGRRI